MTTRPADDLIDRARDASARAYAPYSGFRVGAALKCASGVVYAAANVENASYGLTICAERAAVFCAVVDGHTDFEALAIYADADQPAIPCGACLQVLSEFARELKIYLAARRRRRVVGLAALLPAPFVPEAGTATSGSCSRMQSPGRKRRLAQPARRERTERV
jgi:cytidine deaminase